MKRMSKLLVLGLVIGLMVTTFTVATADTQVTLVAGQHIDAGTVDINDNGDTVTVTFMPGDGWTITETHLAVETAFEDIPQTKSGNPKVGKFDPGVEPVEILDGIITYEVPIPDGAEMLYIAAHAVVVNELENIEETAWGEGISFPGNNWAMYIGYELDGGGYPRR